MANWDGVENDVVYLKINVAANNGVKATVTKIHITGCVGIPVSCPEPMITNGDCDADDVPVPGDVASCDCHDGLELASGNLSRTCGDNGEWTGEEPVCEAITCQELSAPLNGMVILTGTEVGDTATFYCNKGHYQVGMETLNCSDSGDWSGEPPVCKPLCPYLPDPDDGTVTVTGKEFGDVATFSCDDGFQLVGTATLTCEDTGDWSGDAPTCDAITCPKMSDPDDGTVTMTGNEVGDVATFSCDDGFQLVGTATLTCEDTGDWSGDAPTCEAITCPGLSDPDDGSVTTTGNEVGDVATFSCDDGFQLVGTETLTCEDNGDWSGVAPTCEAVMCPGLSDPDDGTVTMTGNAVGDEATFSCDDGFQLVGLETLTCQDTGDWSGVAPTCEENTGCPDVSAPENGRVMKTSLKFGAIALFSCDDGYTLVGKSTLVCQDSGQWNEDVPTCEGHCPVLEDPDHGTVLAMGNLKGDIASFQCDEGYTMKGSATTKCRNSGEWRPVPPTCERDESCDDDLVTTFDDLDFVMTVKPTLTGQDEANALEGSNNKVLVSPGTSYTFSLSKCGGGAVTIKEWRLEVKKATSVTFGMLKEVQGKFTWFEEPMNAGASANNWQLINFPTNDGLRRVRKIRFIFNGDQNIKVRNIFIRAIKK